jgi:hypothetical protein
LSQARWYQRGPKRTRAGVRTTLTGRAAPSRRRCPSGGLRNDVHLHLSEGFGELVRPKVDDDGPVDVKGGGNQAAVCPFAHLGGRGRVGVYIHFNPLDPAFAQPHARPAAVGTPTRTIHHDPAVGERFLLGFFGFGRRRPWCDLPQLGPQHLVVGLLVDIVDVDVADDPLRVDNKDGPLRAALVVPEYAVLFRDSAVRPEIAQQRVANATQALGPCFETRDVVDADAQDLGIKSRELGQVGLVRRDLVRSDRRPCHREEDEDDVLPAQIA